MRGSDLKTWHGEMAVVAVVLVGVSLVRGGATEWLAALAVLATFGHASVAERLREREVSRDVVSVECHRWLGRYWVAKELLWVVFFLVTQAYAALAGCGVFLAYPLWRRWYRKRSPLPRPLPPAPRIEVRKVHGEHWVIVSGGRIGDGDLEKIRQIQAITD